MVDLSIYETRVLGCLLEKERTTPDQYPLTLNALTQACNQKTNREPVLQMTESQSQETVDNLKQKGFISEVVFGSRVTKYKQRFGNTEFSEYSFSNKQLSILCVLFLRGPQTAGELRTRTQRLCDFADVSQVEECLSELTEKQPTAYVVQLDRESGKRENRFMHLFSGAISPSSHIHNGSQEQPSIENTATCESQKNSANQAPNTIALEEKVSSLESRVEQLENKIIELKNLWL